LVVIGYWSGVVFDFSTSTPATRRSMRPSGFHFGATGAADSTALLEFCSLMIPLSLTQNLRCGVVPRIHKFDHSRQKYHWLITRQCIVVIPRFALRIAPNPSPQFSIIPVQFISSLPPPTRW